MILNKTIQWTLILDAINFKSTIKCRVNCGWDSNPYPSNVGSTF